MEKKNARIKIYSPIRTAVDNFFFFLIFGDGKWWILNAFERNQRGLIARINIDLSGRMPQSKT